MGRDAEPHVCQTSLSDWWRLMETTGGGLPGEGWHFLGLVSCGLLRGETATSPKSGEIHLKPHREHILKSLLPPFLDADCKGAQLKKELEFPSVLAEFWSVPCADKLSSRGQELEGIPRIVSDGVTGPIYAKVKTEHRQGFENQFSWFFLISPICYFLFCFLIEILTKKEKKKLSCIWFLGQQGSEV